ncbi:hypothetical protein N9O57_01845 [bacterium]|nr:hypothetical protein [bacterium]
MEATNNKNGASCYNCHHSLDLTAGENVLRTENCPHCEASIRCCRNCKFYDAQSYNECREPMSERIVEKEKVNYCDFYLLQPDPLKEKENLKSVLNQANSLFKD